MSNRHPHGRRRAAIIAGSAATCMVAAGVWFAQGSATAASMPGSLYVNPNTQVVQWVARNPNDSRTAVIRDKIASQPHAKWLAVFNINTIQAETASYLEAASAAGKVPLLSVYEITNRDCGGASAGGAPDLNQYQTWVTAFSKGLGTKPVIIILETDSIALQTCLDTNALNARNQALTKATQTIKAANPQAKVYLDGGHSTWNSASVQANRLKAAGMQYADGFYTNVSNYNKTSNEASYGKAIISALAGLGLPGKTQIIDTSRNGGATGDWCGDDNTDRRIGQYPTLNTGDASIDGYLWVKPPGEADGCGGRTAGTFYPDLAYSLASSAPYPSAAPQVTETSPTAPTSPSTPSTTPPTSPSTSPTGTQGGTGCTAAFTATSTWNGGFQGQMTVSAASAITGWTVSWVMADGQSVSQAWNGTLTTSGNRASVTNLGWNGALAAGTSTTFGFIASGTASGVTAVTCGTA